MVRLARVLQQLDRCKDTRRLDVGVDHDKIILLSTPFPTIPMLGKNGCCGVIVFYVGNKRCCIVLYCIVLY